MSLLKYQWDSLVVVCCCFCLFVCLFVCFLVYELSVIHFFSEPCVKLCVIYWVSELCVWWPTSSSHDGLPAAHMMTYQQLTWWPTSSSHGGWPTSSSHSDLVVPCSSLRYDNKKFCIIISTLSSLHSLLESQKNHSASPFPVRRRTTVIDSTDSRELNLKYMNCGPYLKDMLR